MLSYFDQVKDFMDSQKQEKLYECLKQKTDETELQFWLKRFYDELSLLVGKISRVVEFNSYSVKPEEISVLDNQLRGMLLDVSDFEIFNNTKIKRLVTFINQRIKAVLKEIDSLKADIGQLKHLIGDAKKNAISDINDFLSVAGINYEFDIIEESETSSKTILRYIPPKKEPVEVDDIALHLSWGERNAFALVLFMHHALSQDPDIVILDDPISSFDSNKKYAIIDRLFSSSGRKNSFSKKTVLMLTHDLEPIIDSLINNKPSREFVSVRFLQNKEGIISEQDVSVDDIKSMPLLLAENARNETLNKVQRVASLRKLFEIMPDDNPANSCGYDLLSSLIHCRTTPTYSNEQELPQKEIESGHEAIKRYIPDFQYDTYLKDVFTRDHLLLAFKEENIDYIRLQIFRVLLGVLELQKEIDNPLMKYINEKLHVENDYMFNLNFMKYNIVPDFVIPKCVEFLESKNLLD